MRGFKPYRTAYTTPIEGCLKEGDLKSAMEIMKGMVMEGWELDGEAFMAVVSGLCRADNEGDFQLWMITNSYE
ncbi:hypothetical protein L484_004953 [Morus notabilis]|uniref:Pentatricopeptide repeat-containing protein n=1 Tax=Morus notabilis TaxID=981085 RepID=W9RU26_9ROSA|nr:hypothetical protein L484_004953 [Morus notabilis]